MVDEALPYYQKAIDKAKETAPQMLPTINRELGWALFSKSPFQDVAKAREAYGSALASLRKVGDVTDPILYFTDLFELANWELTEGDWTCGQDLRATAKRIYQTQTFLNPAAPNKYQFFETTSFKIKNDETASQLAAVLRQLRITFLRVDKKGLDSSPQINPAERVSC